MGNDWHRAAFSGHGPVGIAIVALVGDDGAGCLVGSCINQIGQERAIGRLATGQSERNRQPVMVCFQVDFRAESTARSSKRLARLPPFAPAAETWARITVLSNICTRCAVPLIPANMAK